MKKKICVILPSHWSASMGGAEYQAKCFIEHLVELQEYEIFYLTRRFDPSYSPAGYRVIRIANGKGFGRYGLFFDMLPLMRLLHRIQPDVIFLRSGCAYAAIAAHYANKMSCRLLWHIGSDRDVVPFQSDGRLGDINRYIDKKLVEYGIRHCKNITVQTHQQGQLLRKNYGRSPSGIIPNFHPLPTERIAKEDPFKIVWVANFKHLKQPELFVQLAKDLHASGEKVQCIMIGAPSHSYPAWQRALEREISEVPNLSYYGRKSIEEVNLILAKSHLLVNTSLYEGLPNTFIQAWMRKVPVVSLHVDPDGVISSKSIGYCVGDYSEMFKKLVELINDSLLRDQMGKLAQSFAFEEYSKENIRLLMNFI